MKAFLKILLAICLFSPKLIHSQSILVLKPNELYQAPSGQEDQVVMPIRSFAAYHYLAAKQDTLKREIARLDSLLMAQDSLQGTQIDHYEHLLLEKQKELSAYEESYSRLLKTSSACLDQKDQLQFNYLQLEQRHRRVKQWRNWLLGITACLVAGITWSVTK